MGWAGALTLVFVFVVAIVVLLVVTRLAAKRDAAKKAERARRVQAEPRSGSDQR
jgi:hypothetical protein